MSLFKKLGKAVKKLAKSKVISTAVRAGTGIATGGASEAALRGLKVAKQLGQSLRSPNKSKQVEVAIAKLDALPKPTVKNASATPQFRPGGQRINASSSAPRRKVAAMPKAKKAKAPKAKKKSTRKAPSGGLDLKALAAQWRAAGKPGKWIDFVKASR